MNLRCDWIYRCKSMLRAESQNRDVMLSVCFSHVLRFRNDTLIYTLNLAGRLSVCHVSPPSFVVLSYIDGSTCSRSTTTA